MISFLGNLDSPKILGHHNYFAKLLMGNMGNPRSIASYHFTKYVPSSELCSYSIKVFSEDMGHPEPIRIILKSVPYY